MTGGDNWYLERPRDNGSPFLGQSNDATSGDKCLGPNYALPTAQAGHFTGLSVAKFLKTATWSRAGPNAPRAMATLVPLAARVSRFEGMEGHARSADARDPQRGAPRGREARGEGGKVSRGRGIRERREAGVGGRSPAL